MSEYSLGKLQAILSRKEEFPFSNISIAITDSVFKNTPTRLFESDAAVDSAVTVLGSIRSVLVPIIICLILKVLWILYNDESSDPKSKLPLPPGHYGLPLLGESLSFFLNPATFYKKRFQQYGPVFKTHLLGKPTIRLIGADVLGPVLQNEKQLVCMSWPQSVHHLLGEKAMSNQSDLAEHLRMRRLIAKAFTPDALESYLHRVEKVVSRYLQGWCNKGDVLVYNECKRVVSALSADVTLGLELQDEDFDQWYAAQSCITENLFSLPVILPGSLTGLSRGMQARSHMIGIIQEALLQYQNKGGLSSILSRVEQEKGLSKTQLEDCLIELCVAGQEPLSSAFYSIVKELGQRAEVIESLHEEFRELGLLEDCQKELSLSLINQMKYTNNVIKEVLRLSPPIGGAFRKVKETFEINGYQIPRGWSLIYSIRDTQDCSPHFDSAFRPERWESTSESQLHLNYLPFGAGSFACPGRKLAHLFLTVWLIELVRSTDFHLTGKCIPPKENYLPTPKPLDGLPARFYRKK